MSIADAGGQATPRQAQPSILSHLGDLPNLCSLAGLACTLLAIYFSIHHLYYAAMIGMVWAVAFDWADGLIARGMKGRTGKQSEFGGQLDVLIDIVSYGVAPAVLLLSYGNFEPVFLLGAFVMVATSALRLSYFATFGLSGGTKYTGLALDNNSLVIVLVFLFEASLGQETFTRVLYATCIALAALNVSRLKTPKLSGHRICRYALAAYTLGMTAVYAWKLYS